MLSCFRRVRLCDPIDCSLTGTSVHGILYARTLEWVAMTPSSVSSRPRDETLVCCIAGRFFIAEPPEKPKQDYYSYVFQKIHPRSTIPKYFQRGSYPNVHYIVLYSYNRIHNNENKCSLATLISIKVLTNIMLMGVGGHKRAHSVSFHLYNKQKEVLLIYTARKLVNLFKE